jgi:hypothetical protein
MMESEIIIKIRRKKKKKAIIFTPQSHNGKYQRGNP